MLPELSCCGHATHPRYCDSVMSMNSSSYTACALKSGAMLPTSGGDGEPPTMPSPACTTWRQQAFSRDDYALGCHLGCHVSQSARVIAA